MEWEGVDAEDMTGINRDDLYAVLGEALLVDTPSVTGRKFDKRDSGEKWGGNR